MSIEAAKRFHSDHVEPKTGAPVGADTGQVCALERALEVRLPPDYRDFLLWMGQDRDGIFRGSAWFIDDVESNHEILQNLLDEAGSQYCLKRSHVVFFTHQGYMAAWFDAASSESDPQCWFMDDGMTEPRVTGRFSQALLDDMVGLSKML